MNITRTAKFVDGKLVYDPPYTEEELAAQRERFDEMCATRTGPQFLGSEKAFLADVDFRNHGLGDHPEWLQKIIIEKARAAGVNTEGKRYYGGLARDNLGVADPEAWCASQQDVIDCVKRRNKPGSALSVKSGAGTGGVNFQGLKCPPPPDVALSDKLVREEMQKRVNADPGLALKDQRELREQVIDEHGSGRAKKALKQRGTSKRFKDTD